MGFKPNSIRSGIDLILEIELEGGIKKFNLKVKELTQKEIDELNCKKEISNFDLRSKKEALEELISTNPKDKDELEKELQEVKAKLARAKLDLINGNTKVGDEIEKNRPYWKSIINATILDSEHKKDFIQLIDTLEVADLPNLYNYILEEMEKTKKK